MTNRSMLKTSIRLATMFAAGVYVMTLASAAQAGWYGPGGPRKPTEWSTGSFNPTLGHRPVKK